MKLLFRQKFRVNGKDLTGSSSDLEHKTCSYRWDRGVAGIFGFLALLTLVGIVVYNTIRVQKPCSCGNCNNGRKASGGQEFHTKCSLKNYCAMICSSIDETDGEEIAKHVNAVFEASQTVSCKEVELTVENSKFKNYELNKGWLEGVQPKITKLTIKQCYLEKINKAALSGDPFTSLEQLLFIDAGLEILERDSFYGLNGLTDFAYRSDARLRPLRIEERALDGMSSLLTILQISKYILTPQDVINLTGNRSASLSKLLTIDLRHNILTELPPNAFSNAANAVAVYLDEANLRQVDQNAFGSQNRIELLSLKQNGLVTLPEGTFRFLSSLKPGKLFLSKNNWNCQCSLQWLKDYYLRYDYIDKSDPPRCPGGETFDQIPFCVTDSTVIPPSPSMSSATEIETTNPDPSKSTSKQPPLPPLPNFKRIQCRDQKLSQYVIPENAAADIIHTVELVIRDAHINLEFHELDHDPLTVVVLTEDDLEDYHLLWFNSQNKSEYGCVTPLSSNTVLTELNRDTTYTFSLLCGRESEVSPKRCFGLKTEAQWEHRTWISNKFQAVVIGVTVLTLICVICVSALLTFFCIYRHPKLIASNKSVVIVKPGKNSEEPEPPREYERPAYWEPYLNQSSQGYLTPKYHRYAKVKYRPPLMRSFSESSIANNPVGYVDPNIRSEYAWRMLRRQIHHSVREINSYDDFRPPLPPPNPGSRRPEIPMQTSENIYSSV